MAIDLKQTAIDPENDAPEPTRNNREVIRAALGDLQGNILKSHGRDHSRHLFVTFAAATADQRQRARAWLTSMVAQDRVTSALKQWEETRVYREALSRSHADRASSPEAAEAELKSASGVFCGLLLSADGYRALKLDALMPDDPSFGAGAKRRIAVVNDPPLDQWEAHFQRELHALVIVADDFQERLQDFTAGLQAELTAIGATTAEETGTAMRLNAQGQVDATAPVREHFGFADGVSQPLFFARDIDRARSRHGGIDQYDPSAPLNQVLVKDPGGSGDGYGSYFVYRKLAQDVHGFRQDEQTLAQDIAQYAPPGQYGPGVPQECVDLAGAYMVGRFKDGTPVVHRDAPGDGSWFNNFTYDSDVDGVRCPFQAHVRKTNPRGDKQRQFGQPLTQERTVRIVRRAISYGPVTLTPDPKDDVGLLFLCAQSSIADQFEFIQNQWANNGNFLRVRAGYDPVIAPFKPEYAIWPKVYGSRNDLDFSFQPPKPLHYYFAEAVGGRTTMKGGEYFFTPSLSALQAFGRVTG